MFRAGHYVVTDYYYEGEKWFRVEFTKNPERHTHIHCEKGFKAAKMCAVRAQQGMIPDHYPDWMIESINRLWFGPEFMNRTDLDNQVLHMNKPEVRIKKKVERRKKRLAKGYYDKHCFLARA